MGNAIDPIAPRVPFLDQRGNTVSREWFRFFSQARTSGNGVASASVLTVSDQGTFFPNSQILTPAAGELETSTAGRLFNLGLADTAVTPGDYGDASHLVTITVDAKGRTTGIVELELNSDNVTEGVTNLFFTQARARASVSADASTGLAYDVATGIFSLSTTAVAAGSYGDASHVGRFTVDAEGRITAASNQAITIAAVAGAAPIADGVHPCGTGSITTVNGIITAITP